MFVKIKICNGGVLERFCLQIFENLASQRDALFFIFNFPDSSVGKESACNAGDPSSIPGSGRSPGEGKGYPLQYSGLENPMDCIIHKVVRVGQDWVTLNGNAESKSLNLSI